MKTLYWHIGWRKTGTSSLQHFIWSTMNDAGMLGDIQVIPIGTIHQKNVTEHKPYAHHRLTHVGARGLFDKAWAGVREHVNASPAEKFLITSETFSARFGSKPHICRLLNNRMAVFDRIIVLFWVRPPDEYVASLEVQGAKSGAVGRRNGQPPPTFTDERYISILNHLAAAIPRIEFRGNLHGRDNVPELVKCLDLDPSIIRPQSININQTVSPEMYRLQLEVNKWSLKHNLPTTALQATLIKAWDRVPKEGMGKAVSVTLEDRKEVTERNRQLSVRLCRRFGFSIEQMIPSEAELLARAPYNIPEKAPADFVRAIIENIHPDDDTAEIVAALSDAVGSALV